MKKPHSEALQQVIDELKPKLREYLAEKGVLPNSAGRMRCINPSHDDSDPSMHFVRGSNDERLRCWSCSLSADIFGAHAILEQRPQSGAKWVTLNVIPLAEAFGITVPDIVLTPEEQLNIDVWNLYETTSEVFNAFLSRRGAYLRHAASRGIHEDNAIAFGVGTVPWPEMARALEASGVDLTFAAEYGIGPLAFDSDRLSITVRDEDGVVMGFTARYMDYDKKAAKLAKEQKKTYPTKYKHTPSRGPFQMSKVLYGLDRAAKSGLRRLDLFEGHIDVIMLQQAGVTNCACQAGTSLTVEQIESARRKGFVHINLVYDADDAGKLAARDNLAKFQSIPDVSVTVMFLDFGDLDVEAKDRDPDGFIRLLGVEKYRDLEPVTAFDWSLWDHMNAPDYDPYRVADAMVPIVVQERNRIERSRMIATLSQRLGVSEEDVRKEISRREDQQIDETVLDLQKQLQRTRDSKERLKLVQDASSLLSPIATDAGDASFGETLSALDRAYTKFETIKDKILGYDTGIPTLNDVLDGIPKEGSMIGVAGAPNCGKSAFCTTVAGRLLVYNPDQVTVVFHVMDDPRDVAIAKLLASLSGLPIQAIMRYRTAIHPFEHAKVRYDQARDFLRQQVASGNLLIKGQEFGISTKSAEDLLKYAADKTGRRPVYVGDSLHSIVDGESDDERIATKRVVQWAQKVADTGMATMLFTIEVNKQGMTGRPRYKDVAETAKIGFAFKAIGMVYNELHDKGEGARLFWDCKQMDLETGIEQARKRPVVEIYWEKNKINDRKISTWWRLWDHCATVEAMSDAEVKALRAQLGAQDIIPEEFAGVAGMSVPFVGKGVTGAKENVSDDFGVFPSGAALDRDPVHA